MTESLTHHFLGTVERYPERPFLSAKRVGGWSRISYWEAAAQARAVASALLARGLAKGDRVAILSENRPEWVVSDQGLLWAGCVGVPIYPTLTAEQSGHILRDSGARLAFASNPTQVAKLRAAMGGDLPIVCFDGQAEGAMSWTDFLAEGRAAQADQAGALAERLAQQSPEDLASIVYTSGTTGLPKGAMLLHGNFASNVESALPLLGLKPEDASLSFLPLSHVFERIIYYAVVRTGAFIQFATSFDTVAAELQELKPTFMAAVPRVFEKIKARVEQKVATEPFWKQALVRAAFRTAAELEAAKAKGHTPFGLALRASLLDELVFKPIRERTGGRLRFTVSGGAPLAAEVGRFFGHVGIPILEGYGLTETSPAISFNRPDAVVYGSVGHPLPGVQVRLGEDGELLVKGPNVMAGYWNLPEATDEVLKEGWFSTGDVATIDETGRIRIVDRKKEILVLSNGKNVAPAPIENAIREQPHVENAMLVGDQRNFLSAVLVPDFDALKAYAAEQRIAWKELPELLAHPQVQALYQAELAAACQAFARFEQVRKFVLSPRPFDPERELTPKLSIKRREVLRSFERELNALYEAAEAPVLA